MNLKALMLSVALLVPSSIMAADYQIDTKGAHAFINFKASHLGFSWLHGRFNTFTGNFTYDADSLENSKVVVTIDTRSIDSNHAERDKHLRSDDFLSADKHPEAKFVSTKVVDRGNGAFDIVGDFTLNGETNSVTINAKKIGEGKDPWGGYRAGFEGTATINMKDYNFKNAWGEVHLDLHVEGIKQ